MKNKLDLTPDQERIRKAEIAAAVAKAKLAQARKNPNVAVLMEADDVVKQQVGGFINFLREHAIVGLAVGFIIGQQAQGVVKQLVTSFIDPFIQLLFGGAKLSERKTTIHLFSNQATFEWGAMISILVNLLIVLATIYILIKVLKLDKLDKPKVAAPVETTAKKSKKSANRRKK